MICIASVFFDISSKKIGSKARIFVFRRQRINWDTDAFNDDTAYWNEIVQLAAGDTLVKPLNRDLLNRKENLCFNHLYFGVSS